MSPNQTSSDVDTNSRPHHTSEDRSNTSETTSITTNSPPYLPIILEEPPSPTTSSSPLPSSPTTIITYRPPFPSTSSSSTSPSSTPPLLSLNTTKSSPSLATAFFRLQWSHLSHLAYTHSWYPIASFLPNTRLLDEAKFPMLAGAVREVFEVYRERWAWELVPCVYFVEGGDGMEARVAWTHGDLEGIGREERKGIEERARERGLRVGGEVVLREGEGGMWVVVGEGEDGGGQEIGLLSSGA